MNQSHNRPIQKLEVARSQLLTAIQLWFADGDPISIHTLAGAAYQILHDIHMQRGGSPLLFDSVFVKGDRRAQWNHAVKEHMNFFKHADRDPNGTIAFDPSLTEPFLSLSLFILEGLGAQLTPEEAAFQFWCVLHNPDWLDDRGQDRFINRFNADELTEYRHTPRQGFCSMYKLRIHKVITKK